MPITLGDRTRGRLRVLRDEYAVIGVALLVTLGVSGMVVVGILTGTHGPPDDVLAGVPWPTATSDAFPTPGTTVTHTRLVRKDGVVTTETVRAYTTVGANGAPQLVRETVRETAPGVRVTTVETVRAVGPTSLVTLPGGTQVVTQPGQVVTQPGQVVTLPGQVVTLPGQDVTLPGQVVTLPGQDSTQTVTVAGPTATRTVSVTVPGPTDTVTEPGPTVTVTEPGPTVTETVVQAPAGDSTSAADSPTP